MNAVDTNVLVRLLTRDDAEQTVAAEAFVAPGAWISQVVLVETLWVLESVYDVDADGKVTIEPGPVRLEYDPKRFMPQGVAWLTATANGLQQDQRVTINCGSDGIMLQDDEGKVQDVTPRIPAIPVAPWVGRVGLLDP